MAAENGHRNHLSRKSENDDPYSIETAFDENYMKWSERSLKQKVVAVIVGFLKIVGVLGSLYLFICSLNLMGAAFQVLAGKTAGDIFSRNSFLSNPVTGLILGILVTVLVQSSSTSTSIFITMVSVNLSSVHNGIPLIMGANIGTSVTNTIVALGQSTDKNKFRKAFAGATVHDIFNLLSVLILFPIEIASGYLERTTSAIVKSFNIASGIDAPDLLKVITKPLTGRIISVNKTVIELAANQRILREDASMIKVWCKKTSAYINTTFQETVFNATGSGKDELINVTRELKYTLGIEKCDTKNFLFANTGMSDPAVGSILLIVSLVALCVMLVVMVKLLNSLLRGNVARIVKKTINTNFPKPFGWLTGYLAILVGAGMTFLVQSSSVFTSTLTPLVGMSVISLERVYPLTLGANIGTTTTGLLAALASEGSKLESSLQLSLCHFFFNISGIIIWYPIPFMRNIPIKAAKFMGNTTAKYRWFALVYLVMCFFLFPALILALSFAHLWAMGSFLIVFGVILTFVFVVKVLQNKKPNWLPQILQNWKFLPRPLRSLAPYDYVLTACFARCKCGCCKRLTGKKRIKSPRKEGEINVGYESNSNDQTKV